MVGLKCFFVTLNDFKRLLQVISVPLYVVPNSTEFPVIRCTHYYDCKDKLCRRFSATVPAQPEPISIATCLKELQCQGWQVHFVYNANYSSLIAMKIQKYLVNDKIAALYQKIYLASIASNVTDNKSELWKTVRLANFQKPQLQSISIFLRFVHPCLLYYLLCYPHILLMC